MLKIKLHCSILIKRKCGVYPNPKRESFIDLFESVLGAWLQSK